ncbi:zinc finger protein 16 isoform X1 [Sinocyclocheilus anshuiensis]|uniref:Zinc finger protein 16-like n=1 Tax=Sinocyclocheilus anshuiensis TaxID=1608454 RepID=A0A671Q3F5_9TELE|nr:PREDICTED: zinc finger protein 16-like isoform X1 [Sinocyclocheilus anshuiensis]
MSRLDKLHSNLMKRMSIVIRDIWVEVEATVKDYQKEAAQTRSENARLKQQLEDVLSRNQAQLNGVHYVPPDEVSPTELPACGYGSPAESEDPEDQQTEGGAQSEDSPSDLKPHILDVISICKTEAEDRELVHQKDVSSAGEQRLFPQFDSSSTDEMWNRNVPTAATPRVKIEPKDTIITITSSVTTTPAHAGQCQDQMRTASDTSTMSRRQQRKEHHRSRYTKPRRAFTKDHDHEGPYKCNKCGRLLKDLAKLQLHKKLHERSFICHWCGRNFSKFDYLRMHMRTHTGERPYRCNWCSKTFSQSGNMRRHERTCRSFNEEPASHALEDQQLPAE